MFQAISPDPHSGLLNSKLPPLLIHSRLILFQAPSSPSSFWTFQFQAPSQFHLLQLLRLNDSFLILDFSIYIAEVDFNIAQISSNILLCPTSKFSVYIVKVHELAKGRIYAGGTLNHFQLLTGWKGGKVMYFGDHPYADLADVTLHHGWKTAAVIR